jgi:hypothetical protein
MQKMKIKLLTRSSDLNEILLAKLNQIGLIGEIIDYRKPIYLRSQMQR